MLRKFRSLGPVRREALYVSSLFVAAFALQGCGGDGSSETATAGSAGASGSAGNAGSGGTAGTAGSGGTAGSSGSSGTAGSGGTAGSAGTAGSGGTAGAGPCGTGQWAPDGTTCVAAGIAPGGCDPAFTADNAKGCVPKLPSAACPNGTMAMIGETTCQPVGPAALGGPSCPGAITQSGVDGCDVVLPAQACAAGQTALPGETTCHELQACGTGPWGNIPVDATTQYVQQSYNGSMGASDGSSTRPWTTIQQAVTASVSGAIIAVSDGTYAEGVQIAQHPVKLWGRCASKVSVVGPAASSSAISINKQNASEVHSIAISGSATNGGVGVFGAQDVVLDGLWVHDNDSYGVVVQNLQGASTVTLKDSLLGANHGVGLFVSGSTATVLSTVIEDTQPRTSDMSGGQGVIAQANSATMESGVVNLSKSLLSKNHSVGLLLIGSKATVETTVIQDTQPQATDQTFGEGIAVQADSGTQLEAELTMTGSILTENREIGLLVLGGKATLEGSVIQNTLARASDQGAGRGIAAQRLAGANQVPELSVTASTLSKNRAAGVLSFGVKMTISKTVIRDTQPQSSDMTGGQGLAMLLDTANPSGDLTVDSSLIAGNAAFGLFAQGVKVQVSKSTIENTQPRQSDEGFGWGVLAQIDTTSQTGSDLTLSQTLVSNNLGAGLVASGSKVSAEGSVVRDTQAQASDSTRGWGVISNVDSTTQKGSDITLTRSVISGNHDIGMLVSDSRATLDGTVILDTQPRASDNTGGRAIYLQTAATTTTASTLVLRGSLLTNNLETGLFGVRSTATMTGSLIENTKVRSSDQQFGFGVSLYQGSSLSMDGSVVTESASYGVTLRGSTLSMHASSVSCSTGNDIYGDDQTTDFNTGAPITTIPPSFNDEGENSCGCGAAPMTCSMVIPI